MQPRAVATGTPSDGQLSNSQYSFSARGPPAVGEQTFGILARLAGLLIGGAVAGTVSLKVARDTRDAAARAWVRDSRREIYDRFLAAGQRLLAEMETGAATSKVPDELRPAVDEAYRAFFETYAFVQTVAELGVVTTARMHAYRLQALKDSFSGRWSPPAMPCTHSRGHSESQPDRSIATADRHLRWGAEASGQGRGGDPRRTRLVLVANCVLRRMRRAREPAVDPPLSAV